LTPFGNAAVQCTAPVRTGNLEVHRPALTLSSIYYRTPWLRRATFHHMSSLANPTFL
jgi:hypothetical protein